VICWKVAAVTVVAATVTDAFRAFAAPPDAVEMVVNEAAVMIRCPKKHCYCKQE